MKITRWIDADAATQEQWMAAIREIFFETSSRNVFPSPADEEEFWQKWTSYYFTNEPQFIYLAINDDKVAGYLMGCADSLNAQNILAKQNPSYELFADQFKRFPAHLHINLSSKARGQGVGAQLISKFIIGLKEKNISGVHIVTSPDARNVSFYLKEGFSTQVERSWKERPLMFMGKSI